MKIRAESILISIVQLDTLDYATGLRLQERLVALRKEEKISDVLLLLEHKPVITLGRNARSDNILASPELLAQRGVELFETNRGGDVTFHGPGQIVGYPIFDLRGYASGNGHVGTGAPARPVERSSTMGKYLGAVDYVRRLEEVLIRTCVDFAILTQRIPGLTGVWTQQEAAELRSTRTGESARPHTNTTANEAKLAAIGVHISRFVTSHGFALNVNTDLSFFDLIVPCGITTKPVTSMQKELGKPLDLNSVAKSISRNFGTVFSSQILWLDSLDSLVRSSVGVPMKPPEELRKLHGSEDTWA